MQDAYFQEANDVGDWVKIGYTAPGASDATNKSSFASNVFTYTGNSCTGGSNSCTWTAKPKVKLNDCLPSNTQHVWSLSATASGDNGSNKYTAFTIGENNTADVCKVLTASWDNLKGSHN